MKYIIFLALMSAVNLSYAKTAAPTPMYTITTTVYQNTYFLTNTISKVVTEMNKALYSKGLPSFICGFTGDKMGTLLIIVILNGKHRGEKITFNQAIESSIKGLSEAYPC